MDQNLCFNIFIFLIILVIIKYISPNPDSVLFVIKKYLNFLIFKINRFLKQIFKCSEDFSLINNSSNYDNTLINDDNILINDDNSSKNIDNSSKNNDNNSKNNNNSSIKKDFNRVTFKGMQQFQDKAPSFITYHQTIFIQKMIEKNPSLDEKLLKKLYTFIEKMESTDIDDYFLTISDSEQQIFSEYELDKIKTIIFNKLNSGSFKFTDFNIQGPVVYYNNTSGKEVNPFSFTVNCDNNIGQIKMYISIDIRNDVVRNASYIVIKKIRININNDYERNNNVNFDIINNITNDITTDIKNNITTDITNNITNDITKKVIYNSEIEHLPEKCNNIAQPLYYDNPDNLNLKLNVSQDYNIDVNHIEIPNYDDILNSYGNEYNILLDNKNSNTVNMSMPLVNFDQHLKVPTNFGSLEPSNFNDTIYSILDDTRI